MPWLEVVVGLVMLIGLVGTVVPVWPGLVVVWAAGLGYGLVAGFGTVGTVGFALMTVLVAAGTLAKIALPAHAGARRGAPLPTLLWGVVGAVVGAAVLPALGLPVGAVAGVYLAERRRLPDPTEAWRNTWGILKALGVGVLVEFGLGTLMIATWLVWAVRA